LQFRNNRSCVGELYKSFDTLPIVKSRDLEVATFVQKVIHHSIELPIIFRNYLMFNAEFYSYNTRHKQDIHVYRIKTAYGQRMIRCSGPNAWNLLPNYLKEYYSVAPLENVNLIVFCSRDVFCMMSLTKVIDNTYPYLNTSEFVLCYV
jgi:hypothetical protein